MLIAAFRGSNMGVNMVFNDFLIFASAYSDTFRLSLEYSALTNLTWALTLLTIVKNWFDYPSILLARYYICPGLVVAGDGVWLHQVLRVILFCVCVCICEGICVSFFHLGIQTRLYRGADFLSLTLLGMIVSVIYARVLDIQYRMYIDRVLLCLIYIVLLFLYRDMVPVAWYSPAKRIAETGRLLRSMTNIRYIATKGMQVKFEAFENMDVLLR